MISFCFVLLGLWVKNVRNIGCSQQPESQGIISLGNFGWRDEALVNATEHAEHFFFLSFFLLTVFDVSKAHISCDEVVEVKLPKPEDFGEFLRVPVRLLECI